MIFVTVGTQLAFDRLIGVMDDWAANHPDEEIFAQTGPTSIPVNCMRHEEFVSPGFAENLFRQADLIVSHAGMGSILTALKYRIPIIIMPRKADLGEQRNDHQMATAKWLGNHTGINVAMETDDLVGLLDRRESLASGSEISDYASRELIDRLKEYFEKL